MEFPRIAHCARAHSQKFEYFCTENGVIMNRSASPKLQINRTRESHCACQCSSFGVCVCYVCGVHELSLLFRWILSVCLLFFAECLNKGKQIWHMCSTKKRSEIGRDSEEEEDAKRNVPYSMQINEQISFFELNEKQTKQFFSTRHENYAHGMCVIGEMGQGNSIILFTASLLLQLLLSYWFVCMR